ncbi:MAG: hypothetical protein KAI24_00305 [Planctomycetes bacterium]|nr:hypothetical protein [Planctomycetota bacterium]
MSASLASFLRPLSLLVALTFAAAANAQLRRADAPLQHLPCVPIHAAADDEGVAYGKWGAGRDYKASFHDGMTFVPYLGRAYPTNLPVSWRTLSVTAGAEVLVEANEQPAHTARDFRYEYRFAAGVTEAYDLRDDGLEQTFVVERLPAAGDLVVSGRITSPLQAADVVAAQQELVFRDEAGRAIVGYGEAVAFDAAGRQTAVTTALEAGVVTLRVPGAWLAQATLPVVVDPLFYRYFLGSSGGGQQLTSLDVANEAVGPGASVLDCMVVYSRAASASDDDLFAQLHGDGLVPTEWLVFSDITTSWRSDSASAAFVAGADRWAVAFRRLFSSGGSRVRCHAHDRDSTAFGTAVAAVLPTSNTDNHWRPRIGGVMAGETGVHALVVFQVEDNAQQSGVMTNTARSAVHGARFDASQPNGSFGGTFPIASSLLSDYERPHVNRVARGSSQAPYAFVCAMQEHRTSLGGGSDDWDVVCRLVDTAGGVASSSFATDLGAANDRHQMGPIVAGSDGRYAVLFSTLSTSWPISKPSEVEGTELWLQRFDWPSGASAPTASLPSHQLDAETLPGLTPGGLAHQRNDRSRWLAVWRQEDSNRQRARCEMVGYDGQTLHEHGIENLSINQVFYVGAPAICFDAELDEFHIVLTIDQWTQSYARPLIGLQFYDTTVTPWAATGVGCASAAISWVGPQRIGAEFPGVEVDNAGAVTAHFVLVSLGSLQFPVTLGGVGAGCELLVDPGPSYLGMLPMQLGTNVSWPFPLPSWLPNTTLYFQDWILENNEFRSSQRLEVPVVR